MSHLEHPELSIKLFDNLTLWLFLQFHWSVGSQFQFPFTSYFMQIQLVDRVVRTEMVAGTFSGGNLWLVENKKYVVSVGNAFAKWHHQLRVRGMILHSVMLWKTTSEPDTCTQESKGKVVSSPSAKSQFGKWLKKPFFTLMSQRLIDLMRTRLFYERNFIGQLASMEEMERYVFLWRDLRLVEPKNYYCLSKNMNIQNFYF